MFKHYVYSVVGGKKGNNPDWVQYRYDMYRKHTLYNLQHQTEKNFETVLVFYGPEYELALEVFGQIPDVQIVNGITGPHRFANEQMLDEISGADHVYLSRVDTDDIYATDAVEIIQQTPVTDCTVMRANQAQIQYTHPKKNVRIYAWTSNPFQTVVYPSDIFKDEERMEAHASTHFRKKFEHTVYTDIGRFIAAVTIHDMNDTTRSHGKGIRPKRYREFVELMERRFPSLYADWEGSEQHREFINHPEYGPKQ
jgi:hypothetical protein